MPKPANTDKVPKGTPYAGENICRRCSGTGKMEGPECGGTGKIIAPVGGAG